MEDQFVVDGNELACHVARPPRMPSGSADKAARESQRRDFLRVFNAQLEDLQRDPEAWADYWAEAELTAVSDGIDERGTGEAVA